MNAAASATATFLFTDIEGSTLLLKQFRDRYPDLLGEHQRLLREAFAAHGGEVIDTQGDAFFVAFRRAKDAVLAAAAAQRALAAHNWPEGGELRVRMGIHTGEARLAEGRYVGLSVHRAARICAGGYGGQVLVSQTTVSVLEDEEESLSGITLRDLGPQRLKDFDRPVRVHQLDIEDLPREFPPLATRIAPPPTRKRLVAGAVAATLVIAAAATAFLVERGSGTPTIVATSLVRIDPATNEVTDVVKIEDEPDLVVATRRYLWIAHNVFRRPGAAVRRALLSRVDMKTHEATIVGGGLAPCGLTADPSGDVWVATCAPSVDRVETTIVRVDAETLEFKDFVRAPSIPRFAFRGLAYGGGALWIGDPDEDSHERQNVTRIDLDTRRWRSIRVGSRPAALAWATGYLWVPNFYSNSVSRIGGNTNGVETVEDIDSPFPIVITSDAAWVGLRSGDRVARIDRDTFRYDGALILPVKRPGTVFSVAAGERSVWATTPADSAVWRIDPVTNQTRRIGLKYRPTGVAVGGGAVWVAIDDLD
jgi:class 3 adenylate cyclase/DNA-binding beta-propeller fold protein YncE